MEPVYAIAAFNVALGIAGFFGGMVLRDLSSAVKDLRIVNDSLAKELRDADSKITDKLTNFIHKDDFRDLRDEQRDNFKEILSKVDSIQQTLSTKADRREFDRGHQT